MTSKVMSRSASIELHRALAGAASFSSQIILPNLSIHHELNFPISSVSATFFSIANGAAIPEDCELRPERDVKFDSRGA